MHNRVASSPGEANPDLPRLPGLLPLIHSSYISREKGREREKERERERERVEILDRSGTDAPMCGY